MLFNGFWLLDNKQFFENVWGYKNKTTEFMKSQHFVAIKVNQSSPLLLAGCLCAIVCVVQILLSEETLQRMGFTMAMDSLDVDEDLPNFFEALPISEATRILAEND